MSKYGVFSGPYFSVFGLNTETYRVNLRIKSEYRKIRTRKNFVFGHFSRSVICGRPTNVTDMIIEVAFQGARCFIGLRRYANVIDMIIEVELVV